MTGCRSEISSSNNSMEHRSRLLFCSDSFLVRLQRKDTITTSAREVCTSNLLNSLGYAHGAFKTTWNYEKIGVKSLHQWYLGREFGALERSGVPDLSWIDWSQIYPIPSCCERGIRRTASLKWVVKVWTLNYNKKLIFNGTTLFWPTGCDEAVVIWPTHHCTFRGVLLSVASSTFNRDY